MRRKTLEMINSSVADADAASAIALAVDDEINQLQSDLDAAEAKVTGLETREIDQYNLHSDGTTHIRVGVRATKFVVDKTLTATGFAGILDTDWANIVSLPA